MGNYGEPTLAELARAVDRLDRELDEMRKMERTVAVLDSKITVLNARLRVLIAVGTTVGIGLIGTAVSIALAIHK